MRRKIISAAILLILLTVSVFGAEFVKANAYTAGQFTDVPAGEWYASEVASTYELGLMQGDSASTFNPEGNVTVAEILTIASRAHAIYNGNTIDTSFGDQWYTPYYAYALANGIASDGEFDSLDRAAKRAEVAKVFASALPADYYNKINDVAKVPDVPDSYFAKDALLLLYNAGVVVGNDDYGNFFPESKITRAEAAAIINRAALKESRIAKTLKKVSDDDAYTAVINSGMQGTKEGISSGWALDNRGGTPRTSLMGRYGNVSDIDKEAGVAYIRYLNKTDKGVLNLKIRVNGSSQDGLYLAFLNEDGDYTYRIKVINGYYSILTDFGDKPLCNKSAVKSGIIFEIILDLDNGTAKTYLCEQYLGEADLLNGKDGKFNIKQLKVGVDEEGTGTVGVNWAYMTGNYALDEQFRFATWQSGKLPMGWESTGEVTIGGEKMTFGGRSSVSKTFDPQSGTVVGKTEFILPKGEVISYCLKSRGEVVAEFTNDESNFYINGTKVYENYYQNLWYRIRLELDTENMKILFKLNDRKITEVPFAISTTSIDEMSFANKSSTEMTVYLFQVFRKIKHDDYVPVPQIPEGADDYTIGLNYCPIWANGEHFGWSCISPYDDPYPVLGYYDEPSAEVADWEIKYMIEHGIDFPAICIYFVNNQAGPQRIADTEAQQLFEGYMEAEYSDMMNYCILWEALNGKSPNSMDNWKNDYVPYLMENFFKDERYMKIDNKLPIIVFSPESIQSRMGGAANVKEAIWYLDSEVKKLGYDGVIFMACGYSSNMHKSLGFNGVSAYSWGTSGYTAANNINSILRSAADSSVYTVPTVSVGFNSLPWMGVRYPMITKEEYRAAHEWVRDTYLTTYPKEEWQKNFIMLSTWNEYGEGTYIMPTRDERKFDYLDVIRETYTKAGPADESIDMIPTDAQLERLTHRYPQYLRLLRKEGFKGQTVTEDEVSKDYLIDYAKYTGISYEGVTGKQTSAGFTGTTNNRDPMVIVSGLNGKINCDQIAGMEITLKIPKGTRIEVFYYNENERGFTQSNSASYNSSSDDFETVFIPTFPLTNWTGNLQALRIDVGDGGGIDFTIKSVQFYKWKNVSVYSKNASINGNKFQMTFAPELSTSGDIVVAFDPACAMDFLLNAFYEWDKANGVLTLNFKKHVVVYTVGKDTYTVDGVTKNLGFTLTTCDGLPMIPIQKLCEDMGFGFKINDSNEIEVDTELASFFEAQNAPKTPGEWGFDLTGSTDGWSSFNMTLFTNDGYMNCTTNPEYLENDPIIMLTRIELNAADYKKLTFKVRYNYEGTSEQKAQLFFITADDRGWNEEKSVNIPLKSTSSSNGEWETYTVDITAKGWTGTITGLRFDPFNARGEMDIDYIKLTK